mgnify:FL=1
MKRTTLAGLLLLASGAAATARPATNDITMKDTTEFHQIFPQGEANPPANAQYFIGQSYLAPLTRNGALNCPVYNVTFEPGCRNNWHSHTGGQLLLVTAGRGFYQERGQEARQLLPGDVVEIAPNVVHWHGAAPDSWFSHLAVECNPATNRNTWLEPVDDDAYRAATAPKPSQAKTDDGLPNPLAAFASSDPELSALAAGFACGETQQYGSLDRRTRLLVTLASVVALQSDELLAPLLDAALDAGIPPVEIRETVYQTIPYVGMAKGADAVAAMNRRFTARGISLPLEACGTTTPDTRFEQGLALQKSIFGEAIDRMYETSPADQIHIQHYLSANCFGDYQTRRGLDAATRELLTFATLVSLGGCEPQVKGHILGNARVGNGKPTLLAVVTQLLPYIGYPRSLNAIACLNEVLPEAK